MTSGISNGIKENVSLKPLTTFRIGGKARFFCLINNIEDLKKATNFAKENKLEIFILGGGSNILVADEGFSGVVIRMNILGTEIKKSADGTQVSVGAGVSWDEFVGEMVLKNIYGLENLSLIPGSVGAAPIQNIGAYGKEVKDFIDSVEVFDIKNLKEVKLSNKDCNFSYRDSIFKKEDGKNLVITRVNFLLNGNFNPDITYKDLKDYFLGKEPEITPFKLRQAVISIRKGKLPDLKVYGTAGSFFKNPIIDEDLTRSLLGNYPNIPNWRDRDGKTKVSAGFLIDKVCGLGKEQVGDACVWEKQNLVLINKGEAMAKDVLELSGKIKKCVKEKTGINLEQEVQFIS
ncbi:MAG: UDP-N-acetylmuramate dehydrogenase [Patescibacteria group bacterium]